MSSSILEPARWQDTANASFRLKNNAASRGDASKSFFSDTHFPVRKCLSDWFGGVLGNETATYMLVTIQKQAQYQQQVGSIWLTHLVM